MPGVSGAGGICLSRLPALVQLSYPEYSSTGPRLCAYPPFLFLQEQMDNKQIIKK